MPARWQTEPPMTKHSTTPGCAGAAPTGAGWDGYDRAHTALAPPAEQEVRLTTGEPTATRRS